eukprot:TRINITY_DN3436_c0_g2_i1.p1 TRINITY_DN3436_c0_g2~~TRINITY_DN3436_c0_g2_i1.p1  ORF type:complete len:148 (-),score=32.14 TRINITY_DN3436_c0_g2_i1:493-936(-)
MGKFDHAFGKATVEGRLCCIPRGSITLKAECDKNAYVVSETASIMTEILNKSSKNINDIFVLFVRVICYEDGEHNRNIEYKTVYEEGYEGVKAGKRKSLNIPLTFEESWLPTTSGLCVQCRYHLYVRCHCPDVEVKVSIFKAPSSMG